MKSFKIVAISDTHSKHENLVIPPCDILIHAGDATFGGEPNELRDFAEWLDEQDAAHIVYVPGNHELWLEKNLTLGISILKKYCPAINVLIHEFVDIEGVRIFGSPATPWFCNWAWNYARTDEEAALRNIPHINTIWDNIPIDTDILVTHGQPYRILDQLITGEFVGDYNLMSVIIDIKPDLVIGGHIHCGHGQEHHEGTSFYNVSICDERYLPINPITVVDYEFE